VIALTHRELGKTLLFFLEVDRENQPLRSSSRPQGAVQRKIFNYQAYLRLERYRRYEQILQCRLIGFRLLILTCSPSHLAAICRLVRQAAPSDFIWLTDQESLLSRGIWAPIWVRGGRATEPPESILGTRMPNPCPAPTELP
jgi:hypothetical protein